MSRREIAPRKWVGTTILGGEAVAVEATLCRHQDGESRMIRSEDPSKEAFLRLVAEGLEYYLVGKLKHLPEGLVPRFVGGRLEIVFPEFRIKALLQNDQGDILSCSRPMPVSEDNDGWSAVELWLMSGGTL